jgi:hypothetical protein
MRKFFVSLIILILAAGAVFYFGWVQFKLPPNSYGVIFTKTHGWEKEIVRAGDFVWRWQRLLPTNLTLYVFSAAPHNTTVSATGSLPSAENYSQFLDQAPDFSYAITLDVSFRVQPGQLVDLARSEGLLPSDLEAWYERKAEAIEAAAPQLVVDSMSAAMNADDETPLAGLSDRILPQLEQRFATIEFLSVAPQEVRVPDVELYLRAKEIYLSALDAREEAASAAAAAQSTQAIQTEGRLQILRSYGDILDSYPVLLDYFRLQAETGVDPLNITGVQTGQ